MRKVIVCIFVCWAITLQAQPEFYYQPQSYDYKISEWSRYLIGKEIADLGIKKVVAYEEIPHAKKGSLGKYKTEETVYDDNHRMTSHETWKQNGTLKKRYTVEYAGYDCIIRMYNAKGILENSTIYKYDADSNLTLFEQQQGPECKLQRRMVTTYNNEHHMLERSVFGKKGKLSDRWVYEYNGKKLWRSIAYDGKGKILHTWNHDCLPEGTEQGKNSKDTTTICRKFETDKDGNLLIVTRTADEKGNYVMGRTIYYPDTVLKAYYTYDYKGNILSSWVANNKYNNYSEYFLYYKGKETQHVYNEFKDGLRVRSDVYFRKRPAQSTRFFYDQNKCLVKAERWDDIDKELLSTHYFEISTSL